MPPKRRTPAKAAPPSAKAAPPPAKSQPTKSAPAPPPPPPPPPPPQPVETPAAKVRKEWYNFIDSWYEPRVKKLQEQLQKELTAKYKKPGSSRLQKAHETELQRSLAKLPEQLAAPARAEWEKRLRAAQLLEDQWTDMTGEEQQAVLSVFVGFFGDDDDEQDDDDDEEEDDDDEQGKMDISTDPSSVEEDESAVHPNKLPPTTPIKGTFEFVNPSSLFDVTTPPNPTKHLPALSMDHLVTLTSTNSGRQNEPVSAGGVFGFHHWASEAGIASQQPHVQVSNATSQPLGSRPRATDNISRQASSAATHITPSPPLFSNKTSPQYSPPVATTKVSPPMATESLPLGKRYIGPVIVDEESDPTDEELLKSKMAADYQEYKISLRVQMILQFHEEAAQIEIQLVKHLLADEGTKESRAKAVQDHETSMMFLREQKEEERKKLAAEEREKRREELKILLAQAALRSSSRNREPDLRMPKANAPKPWPDKAVPQRGGQAVHQKENIPLVQPPVVSSTKLEPPTSVKKSNSGALSHEAAASNEALFANAAALLAQSKQGTGGLTASQAATNEAKFANAAAQLLASQGKPGVNGLSTPHLPSAMKKTNSARSQEPEAPQLTVSFADAATPASASAPTAVTAKGKKGKKAQPVVQPAKPTVIAEEPDIDAEPPPAPVWGTSGTDPWPTAPTSFDFDKRKQWPSTEENSPNTFQWMPGTRGEYGAAVPPARSNAKKSDGKKSKVVTITEVSDVDADPIVGVSSSAPSSLASKAVKNAWGTMNGKRSKTPAVVIEEVEDESEPEPVVPPPPPVTSAKGKKSTKTPPVPPPSTKQSKKAFVSEEQEGEEEVEVDVEPVASAWATRASKGTKNAWTVPTKATKKASPSAEPPRRGTEATTSKVARVESVPDSEDDWAEVDATTSMPGGLEFDTTGGDEGSKSAWFEQGETDYWAGYTSGSGEANLAESAAKHVRWTPTVAQDSDEEDEPEAFGDELQSNIWLQYAMHQGDESMEYETPVNAGTDMRTWEQAKGKKKAHTMFSGEEVGKSGEGYHDRAQNASMFYKATPGVGQWPTNMENWLSSAPRVGQSSGSARFF